MKNADLPAIPYQADEFVAVMNANQLKETLGFFGGLTKREYFAGLAMQGIFVKDDVTINNAAKHAVSMADALLAELERTK